jgi:glutathione peroxidase
MFWVKECGASLKASLNRMTQFAWWLQRFSFSTLERRPSNRYEDHLMNSLLNIPLKTIHGEHKVLADYPASAYLIVNTASKCGFTPQYEGLEKLWQGWKTRGLYVLGFPCNQFGHQEAGSEPEIESFCQLNFGVTFPLFAKIDVNGEHAHPLFQELKKRAPGFLGSQAIKWNFTKFLLSADGSKVERFATFTKPEKLQRDLQRLLASA